MRLISYYFFSHTFKCLKFFIMTMYMMLMMMDKAKKKKKQTFWIYNLKLNKWNKFKKNKKQIERGGTILLAINSLYFILVKFWYITQVIIIRRRYFFLFFFWFDNNNKNNGGFILQYKSCVNPFCINRFCLFFFISNHSLYHIISLIFIV